MAVNLKRLLAIRLNLYMLAALLLAGAIGYFAGLDVGRRKQSPGFPSEKKVFEGLQRSPAMPSVAYLSSFSEVEYSSHGITVRIYQALMDKASKEERKRHEFNLYSVLHRVMPAWSGACRTIQNISEDNPAIFAFSDVRPAIWCNGYKISFGMKISDAGATRLIYIDENDDWKAELWL